MSLTESQTPVSVPQPSSLLKTLPPKAARDTNPELPEDKRVFYMNGQREEAIKKIWMDEGEQMIEAIDANTMKAGDYVVKMSGDLVNMAVCFSGTVDSREHIPLDERRFFVHCGLVVNGKFTISKEGEKPVTAKWMIVDRRWNGISMQFCENQGDCWEHFTDFELAGEAIGLRSDCITTTQLMKGKLIAADVVSRFTGDWGREFIHLQPDEILEAVFERNDMTNCTVFITRCAISMAKDPQIPIMGIHSAYHRMAKHLTHRLKGQRARL